MPTQIEPAEQALNSVRNVLEAGIAFDPSALVHVGANGQLITDFAVHVEVHKALIEVMEYFQAQLSMSKDLFKNKPIQRGIYEHVLRIGIADVYAPRGNPPALVNMDKP